MANLLLRIFLVVLTLIAGLAVIGSLLSRDYRAESEITIDAPPEFVFHYVNRLKAWPSWSNWNMRDNRSIEISYSGADSGVGAVQSWTEPRGTGKLWISNSIPPEQIDYVSEFADFPRMDCRFVFANADGKTNILWTNAGSLPGGPFYGFFGQSFSSILKADCDRALGRLKELVELKFQERSVDPAAPK